MKRYVIALMVILAWVQLAAQQVSRVGVVDMNRVYQEFFRESEAVRRLEQMRQNFQREIARLNEEINQLEQQLLNARSRNNQQEILSLEQNLTSKREYLREFIRVRQTQLNSEREALTRSGTFVSQIQSAIQFIAETRGFTMVFRSDDPNLLYYNVDSDITDLVVRRLQNPNMR